MAFDDFGQIEDFAQKLQQALPNLQGQLGNLQGGLGGINYTSYITYAACAAACFFLLPRLLKTRGLAIPLALRRFEVRPKMDRLLLIEGRRTGAFGWIGTTLGLNPISRLTVTKQGARLESDGVFGSRCEVIPPEFIAGFGAGTTRPPGMLLAALLAPAMGYMILRGMGMFIGLVAGAVLFWRFAAVKRFSFEVRGAGGSVLGMTFTPSILDGASVDVDQLLDAVKVIQESLIGRPMPSLELVEESPTRTPKETLRTETPHAAPTISIQPTPTRVFEPESTSNSLRASHVVHPAPDPRPGRPAVVQPQERTAKRKVRRAGQIIPKKDLPVDMPPAGSPEEAEAQAAFIAAVRVFESGRQKEAVRAWKALIGRWPKSDAARRAKRILRNRRDEAQNGS